MDNKVILDIVVDVQKDFITGALANPEAQTTVAHLAETARQNAEAGHWMFFTKDTHREHGRLELCARAGGRHGQNRAGGFPHLLQKNLWRLYAAQRYSG